MMCRFVVAVWFGKNRFNFDLIEATSILDPSKRQLIADWFLDPFWP